MQRALSFDDTPPLSLPLRYFLSVPVFALLAAAVLLWQGPDAFLSRWSPAMLAMTHLLTLGVLTMAMAGALFQILPVVLSARMLQPGLSATSIHALLCSGTVLLASGFWWSRPWLFQAALPVLIVGVSWLVVACAASLWRLRSNAAAAMQAGICLSLAALLPAMLLGAAMASTYIWALSLPLLMLTELHVMWGLLGWVGLLLIGVAFQMMPMFQVTPLYPGYATRWLTSGLVLLMLASSMAQLAGHWSLRLFQLLLLSGFVAFAGMTLYLLSRRKRPAPDVTTRYWRMAMASLLACAALWMAPLDGAFHAQLTGLLFLLGFAYSAVLGMLYKIVPFLLWYHWQQSGPGQAVPSIKRILPEQHALRQFYTHLAALLLLAAAIIWPQHLTRPAALLFTFSTGQLGWNLYRAMRAQACAQPT